MIHNVLYTNVLFVYLCGRVITLNNDFLYAIPQLCLLNLRCSLDILLTHYLSALFYEFAAVFDFCEECKFPRSVIMIKLCRIIIRKKRKKWQANKLGGRIKISPADKSGQGNRLRQPPNLAKAALEIVFR